MVKRITEWVRGLFSKRSWLVLILVGLIGFLIGALIPLISKPDIAKITINSPITTQSYTDDVLKMLSYAKNEKSIKGVILEIDSPGGTVSLIEQVYYSVLELRKEKPVVTFIGLKALSGGYYIAVASNYIFCQSASVIGNIGARGKLPSSEELKENVIISGPFKETGFSEKRLRINLERFKQDFISAVVIQRGERLKISPEEISKAEVYTGWEALKYGLIDEIGMIDTAIKKVAKLAKVRNYGLVDVSKKLGIQKPFFFIISYSELKPDCYYLYLEKGVK